MYKSDHRELKLKVIKFFLIWSYDFLQNEIRILPFLSSMESKRRLLIEGIAFKRSEIMV
jgi:hypothetical protein